MKEQIAVETIAPYYTWWLDRACGGCILTSLKQDV
jgi:hypothetical protein